MTEVLVVGGGDQGRQVISTIEAAGRDRVVGVLDYAIEVGTDVSGCRVLGMDDAVGEIAREWGATGFVVAIGDNAQRASLAERLRAQCPEIELRSVVHPSATARGRRDGG